MTDKILGFIKALFTIYWKNKPFRTFVALDALVLVGFSALKITYHFTSSEHSFGIEITQGEYNWALVIILAIINIPFVIFLINDSRKTKPESFQKPKYEVKVGYFFKDGHVEALSPIFERKTISYQLSPQSKLFGTAVSRIGAVPFAKTLANFSCTERVIAKNFKVIQGKINKSFYPVQFYLENIGKPSLKCFELIFSFGDDVVAIKEDNKEMQWLYKFLAIDNTSTYIDEQNKLVSLKQNATMLVGGGNIMTSPIFIKPTYPCEKITVQWKLLADEFQTSGSLEIPVKADLIDTCHTHTVDGYENLKREEVSINDYIEDIY